MRHDRVRGVLTLARFTSLVVAVASGCGRLGFEQRAAGDAAIDAVDAGDSSCGVTAGLLGHWALDASDLAGASVLDRSARGQHGVIVGTEPPSITTGMVGDAFDFDGVSYVDLPNLPIDPTLGRETTVALWFFHDDPNVDEGVLFWPQGATAAPPRYDLWLTDRAGPVSLCINTGEGDCWGITDGGLIGRWVHVAAVFVNGQIDGGSLFVDGAPVAMACRFGTCTNTRVVQLPVGLGSTDATYAWYGSLDDVRIYSRALTAAEVAQLYDCRR